MQYARRAAKKGDYDLGLQVAAQETDVEFTALSKKLTTAKRIRSSVKWAAMTAILCVVALGAKSIYDNGIITDLNTEVSLRKGEADEAIAAADSARHAAVSATNDATTARANAKAAQEEAEQSKLVAAASAENAKLAKQEAAEALASADASTAAAAQSKMEAATAIAAAEVAGKKARSKPLNWWRQLKSASQRPGRATAGRNCVACRSGGNPKPVHSWTDVEPELLRCDQRN